MPLPFLLFAAAGLAQSAFDVASIKPGGPVRPDGLLDINLGTVVHGMVTLSNATLSECILFAYGFSSEEQVAGPDWIRERATRFQIAAKAPPDTGPDQIRLMMQALLKERFRLEAHREPRRIAHFDLTVGKNGPKMPVSEGDGPSERRDYGRGRLSYRRLSMDRLAALLSRQLKEPVFDRTGLRGAYDVELNWTPEDSPPGDAGKQPEIFGALQQQLGLKLERSKEPVEVLVVDRAEKSPVAN